MEQLAIQNASNKSFNLDVFKKMSHQQIYACPRLRKAGDVCASPLTKANKDWLGRKTNLIGRQNPTKLHSGPQWLSAGHCVS